MRARHTDAAKQVAQEQAEEKLEQAAIANAHASLAALVKHVAQRIAQPAKVVIPNGRVALIELGSRTHTPQDETVEADELVRVNEVAEDTQEEALAASTADASTEAEQEDDEDEEADDDDEVTHLIQIKG
jgi:hypothetical protein